MKKIITAIGNPMLNQKIKNSEKYQLITEDIKTDEELIEWLERAGEIDVLFLHSDIIKNYSTDEFLRIIREIQENIFIIFFKNEGVEISMEETQNFKIYTNKEIEWQILEEILEKEKSVEQETENFTAQIISISGTSGVGKSTFSTFLAKNVENENLKILLIDFDLDENHIRTILKIKKQPEYVDNIKNIIININKNLDVLCHLDFIFENRDKIDYLKIQEILNQLKKDYNLIIIDTSSNLENEYTKRIFYNSDEIIFLLEPNILGVKKSKNMLEVFENDWKMDISKIKMILNKTNIYQISDEIIKELFPDIKLLGKMKYMDSYNLMINKNVDKKEIKREYERIYKKIL